MITELCIDNLGVIARLELPLGPGLTAVTGETGAGKTMIVEAIDLVVGGRSDASMVRRGAAEARVDARIVTTDGTEMVLSRVIPSSGRSRAYVDGRPATVATLASVAADCIDLHGQHAHQSLLSAATQRAALDEYGGVDLEPLRAARARLTEIDASIAALGGDPRERAREIDLLRFQIGELDAAGIVDTEEDARLDREEALLADATAHREAGESAIDALSADGGGRDVLGAAATELAARAPFSELAGRLRNVLAELDDITSELRSHTETIEESPERLAEVRSRRQLLRDMCRKYGDDLAAVMAFHAEADERLRELSAHDDRLAELELERLEALATEQRCADEVGAQRRRAAPLLAAAVQRQLRELAMPDAEIAVDVGGAEEDRPGDHVRFLLAANRGGGLLPLTRVASGGELARAMLALRLVLSGATTVDHQTANNQAADNAAADRAAADGTAADRAAANREQTIGPADAMSADAAFDTLIFDEVDAGIGGTAAHAIGRALAELGAHHQVLVVTHLAQVAAAATAHVHVEKRVVDDVTVAEAGVLAEDRRVVELARMLSGSETESALEHARELLLTASRG